MAISNPLVVTIDGVAHNLVRINQDNFGSVYLKKATDLELKVVIRHAYEGKAGDNQYERHNVDMTKTTWTAGLNPIVTQVYTVMRTPRAVDPDRVADQSIGFNAMITANIVDLTNWVS